MGELRTVLYAWMFHNVVTPGSAPAVTLPFILPGLQPPPDGAQLPTFGFGVFSLAEPAHHRGPLNGELAGSALASPRPWPVVRHVPGADSETPTDSVNVESPPKRVTLPCVTRVTCG